MAHITINLSAIGSKISPIFDSTFHFLANNPSKKSLIPEAKKSILAHNFNILSSKKNNIANIGDEKSLKNVNKFGIKCLDFSDIFMKINKTNFK